MLCTPAPGGGRAPCVILAAAPGAYPDRGLGA